MNTHYSSNTYTFLSYLEYQKRKYAYSNYIIPIQKPICISKPEYSFSTNNLFEDDDNYDSDDDNYDSDDDDEPNKYDDNFILYSYTEEENTSNEFSAYPKHISSDESLSCNLFTGIWR